MNAKTLSEKLERDRVVGWIDTAYHDVHRKIRMLANGDSSVLFSSDQRPGSGARSRFVRRNSVP